MLAATYLDAYKIEARETPIPRPGKDEALIKVFSCGICGSDLAIVSGKHPRVKPPLIIGHEIAGEIVELPGKVKSSFRTGDKVTIFPLLTCGDCYACRNGISHVCKSLRLIGFDRNGGMAEYVSVPLEMLVKLPDSMSYETGSLIEPLAVSVHSVSISPVKPTDKTVVIGAGPIGLLTAMVLQHLGVENLFISDIDPFRIAIAKTIGLKAINSAKVDIIKYIEENTNGDFADIVFEVAGVQESARQMTELLRPRGTVINVSVFKDQPVVDMREINFKELTVIGTRVYTQDDYQRAIEIADELPLANIITHRLPLANVTDAFDLFFSNKTVCKVLFQ